MAERPCVLMVIPNLGPGGAQQVFREHFTWLRPNFDVRGVVFNWAGANQGEWPEPIYSLEVPAGSSLVAKVVCFWRRVARLRDLKKKVRPLYCISHLEGADYVNLLSKRKERVLVWIHGSKQHDANIAGLLGWLRIQVLLPLLYRYAFRICCVSRGIAHELSVNYPRLASRILIVHNGIDVSHVRVKANSAIEPFVAELFQHHQVIVAHTRFARQKNLEAFIQLAAQTKHNTLLRWVLVGDGELRDELLARSRQLGLNIYDCWSANQPEPLCTLYFLGYRPNPFPYISRAAVYLMTSSWEGFPLALCEAMACGLPVIATDCPTGPREILTDTWRGDTREPTEVDYGVLLPLLLEESTIVSVARFLEAFANNPQTLAIYKSKSETRVGRFTGESSRKLLVDLLHGGSLAATEEMNLRKSAP